MMTLSSKCLFVDVVRMLFDLEWTLLHLVENLSLNRCKTIISCGREWCAWNWQWRMICYTLSLAYNSGLLIFLSVFLFWCHTAFQAWSYKKTFSRRTWKPHKPKVAPSGMHVNTHTHIHTYTCTYTDTVSWLIRQKCIKIWTWNSSRRNTNKIYIVRYQRGPFFTEGRDKNSLEYLE